MSDESQRPIVIKRIKKGGHGAHGGVWKLAYADFMTAMMAFFLLMWLLGSTSKSDLQGVEGFFDNTPVTLTLAGGEAASDSQVPIDGGGKDVTRTVGVNKACDSRTQRRKEAAPSSLEAQLQVIEAKKLRAVQAQIETAIQGSDFLRQYSNQLLLDMTAEGLRIQIVDDQNRPMFASGSASVLPHAREIMRQIGLALNDVDNLVSISGHTDAMPYSSSGRGSYSNWELSADRANAARRELIAGGMTNDRVLRVVGLGSAVPFDPENPFAPINRRISIVVLNKTTQEAIQNSGDRLASEEPTAEEASAGTAPQSSPAPVPAGPTPASASGTGASSTVPASGAAPAAPTTPTPAGGPPTSATALGVTPTPPQPRR